MSLVVAILVNPFGLERADGWQNDRRGDQAKDKQAEDKQVETESPAADARAEVEKFWPVNRILNQAVRNLARRYSLNDVQTEYTREMLTTRVQGFLESHHDEIFPLIRDLTWYQQRGDVPSTDTAKNMGPRILEMIRLAKEEIYRGNEEWREYLNEDQRRVHDFDLQEMNKTFDQMEGNFQKWADGSPSPAGIFPQQSPPANDPAPPTKPDDGHMPTGFAKKGDTIRLDSHFDEYVAKFVKDFDLSPPQVEAAESILRELKREVSEYTADKAEALAAIKKNLEEVKSLKERRDWKRRQSVITEPINELFSQLKTRLDQIPDQAQRDRYELAQRNAPNVSSQRGEKDKTASDSGAAGQSPKTRRPTPNSKEDEGSQSKSK